MIRAFPIVWLISSIILFAGCVCPDSKKIKYHATVGLSRNTIGHVFNDRPMKIKVRIYETDDLVEVVLYRDDKKGE